MESQAEYERRSLMEAVRHQQEVERAPLADRKEAQAEWFRAISEDPALVAERLGWLIDGNYGYGEMIRAKQVVASPRMNRVAALSQMVACFEWQCPSAMAVAAWKRLTKKQQQDLARAVEVVIKAAEEEMDAERAAVR